jgi:hypothetical protein
MYAAVVTALQAAPESLGVAALPARRQRLEDIIARIYHLAQIQKQTTRGKTARRDELSESMIDLVLDVASAVAAYAAEHRLTELAKTVEVSGTTFRRMRLPHRPVLAQQIHDQAESLLAELAAYNVTAEMLADLQARIGLLKAWLDQPRSMIRAKSAATAQLATAFREAHALLEGQIDRLVFPLRKTHPEFYADYQQARAIWSPRGASGTQNAPTATLDAASDGGTSPAPAQPQAA